MNDWILEFDASRTIQLTVQNHRLMPSLSKSQYEQHGAIRSTRNESEDDIEYTCYIEYEDQQVASKLLSRGFIYIDDVKIPINYTDQQSVNLHTSISDQLSMLKLSPTEGSSSEKENILAALNDDCLRSIFDKLHVRSLCSVANVCVRFNELAKEIFKRQFKEKYLEFIDLVQAYPISLEQIHKFLIDFGSFIIKLSVQPYEINSNELDDILRLLSQYCTNIKHLVLDDITVNDEIFTEVRPLLSRLEYLFIKCKHNQSFVDLMSSCSQLKRLSIDHVDVDERISSEFVAPNMISLQAFYCSNNYLQPFLSVNPQLKMVRVSNMFSMDSIVDTQSFISENFPHIESFRIHINGVMVDFSKLQHLSSLMITCNDRSVSPLMESIRENNIKLKGLHITDGSIDNHGVNCISGMKSIESLGMIRIDGFNKEKLTILFKRLPSLEVLTISECGDLVFIRDIIQEAISFAKCLKDLRTSLLLIGAELPKTIEKDFRDIAKVVKKCGHKPFNVSVEVLAQTSNTIRNKSIYIKNEWLNIELTLHV